MDRLDFGVAQFPLGLVEHNREFWVEFAIGLGFAVGLVMHMIVPTRGGEET